MMYVLCECFADLVPLQMLILYTSLIIPQSLNCYPLFSFIETFGGYRAIWKENHHHYAPYATQCSDNEKFKLPGR